MESYIEITTKNIIDNYKAIKEYCQKPVIAVIKDNAYGHSLIQIGKTLANNNAFMLAVSSINEAISLRKNMIFTPILLLGRCDDSRTIYSLKITQGISSLDQLKTLIKDNIPISIHLEIETGMHRLGLTEDETEEALFLIKNSHLKLKGVYTHFCSEDNNLQKEKFESIIKKYFLNQKLLIHAQASNFINNHLSYCNAVRVGLALYGYSKHLFVKPSLKLICPIIRCQPIKKDELVGYDFIEKTLSDGYILTIPFGYSSGLSRFKTLCFTLNNKIYYQIGKSCMDMMMFFSEEKIESGTLIEIISENNTQILLSLNDDNIYYALSSLSPNIKRIFK